MSYPKYLYFTDDQNAFTSNESAYKLSRPSITEEEHQANGSKTLCSVWRKNRTATACNLIIINESDEKCFTDEEQSRMTDKPTVT